MFFIKCFENHKVDRIVRRNSELSESLSYVLSDLREK